MTDLQATLRLVDNFLEYQKYYPDFVTDGRKDGHWIRWCIETYSTTDFCLSCEAPYLREIMRLLESGEYENPRTGKRSLWPRGATNMALRAGGFPEWT